MKSLMIIVLAVYKKYFSLLIKLLLGGGCRYEPTCSEYAQEALERHGALKGTALTLKRVGRCHPWGGFGFDPVPKKA